MTIQVGRPGMCRFEGLKAYGAEKFTDAASIRTVFAVAPARYRRLL